jgi:hypothetical protein
MARFTTTADELSVSGSFNPLFTDSTGTLAGVTTTGNYTLNGNMLFYCISVEFDGYTNLGTGQYQFTLPFAARQTFTSRAGTLHNPNADARYHIASITDIAVSRTVAKLYYQEAQQIFSGNIIHQYLGHTTQLILTLVDSTRLILNLK